ncbi:MAG: translation elongation factor 4, partial [Malacoplasma sp.]
MKQKLIRNFSIIAHIDHGKSTLSDRIIEMTNGLSMREMRNQVLDSMDIERERGITIKLNAVQLEYTTTDGVTYFFHLIDTPGHVDFTYEVSRSLAACEGALLVVDASQGVEAQTLSNVYLALENNLEIIPIINKIDLPTADVEKVKKEIENLIGLDCSNAPLVSAKTGLNIESIFPQIINLIPPPKNSLDNDSLQALIFDSYYDPYKGVVCLIRIKNGSIKIGDHIKLMSNNVSFIVSELGITTPKIVNRTSLLSGEVGWLAAAIKDIKVVHVGDTITGCDNPCANSLPGYKKILPMVYCGLYPIDTSQYEYFKEALQKISLSDSSLVYEYETSQALGFGIRCGFLGLLHMEVIKERIEREFNIYLISTAPSVIYKIILTNGDEKDIDSPSKLPDKTLYKYILEPYAKLEIIVPETYLGNVMELCQKNRAVYSDLQNVEGNRKKIIYTIPLSEIMYNFFDKLKSCSKGYATMDYEVLDHRKDDLVKVDILLNGTRIDALSMIMHRDFSGERSRK